jgi:predicted CopG family antitoxin
MSTKTITITKEAYERLKSRKSENQSFSEVILQNFPSKRMFSEILAEIGKDDELAHRIEAASKRCADPKHTMLRYDDCNPIHYSTVDRAAAPDRRSSRR